MKLKSATLLILGIGLLANCQNKSTDDPEMIKQILVNYFDGIKKNDHKEMTDAIASDFFLYENGHAWTNDSVYMNMERSSPYTVDFIFDNVKISVDQKIAHMTYDEHAHFIFQDTIKANLNFLGSAAFRKSDEGWKMYFLQATKVYERKKK